MNENTTKLISDGLYWETKGDKERAIKLYELATHRRDLVQSEKDKLFKLIARLKKEVKDDR